MDPAKAVTYETGFRGFPTEWMRYDVSAFLITFRDQFGRVDTNLQNVGNSKTTGLEIAGDVDMVGLFDAAFDSQVGQKFGALRLYANTSFLDAEFTSGPADGKTPQYAPDYLIRTGVIYDYFREVKVAFLGTFVDSHFADDGNSENRFIPSYKVWDLTVEIPLVADRFAITGGVNNIFNENYYSRVRSNGIDPASPRNAYAGFSLEF